MEDSKNNSWFEVNKGTEKSEKIQEIYQYGVCKSKMEERAKECNIV